MWSAQLRMRVELFSSFLSVASLSYPRRRRRVVFLFCFLSQQRQGVMSKKGVLFLQIRGVLPLGKVHLGHFGGSAVDPGVAAMKETGSVLVGDFHASVSRECTIIGCASP